MFNENFIKMTNGFERVIAFWRCQCVVCPSYVSDVPDVYSLEAFIEDGICLCTDYSFKCPLMFDKKLFNNVLNGVENENGF